MTDDQAVAAEDVQARPVQTFAERNRVKVARRLQFTMNANGPDESRFLHAYDEVMGLAGSRVAGEYLRRCLLVGSAVMTGADPEIKALLQQLGASGGGNIDPQDRPVAADAVAPKGVEATIADNTQTNESTVRSANESLGESNADNVEAGGTSTAGDAKAQGQRVMSGLLGVRGTATGPMA